MKTFKVAVACVNAGGEPDIAFFSVKAKNDFEASENAKDKAKDNDYEEPMIAFVQGVDSASEKITFPQ